MVNDHQMTKHFQSKAGLLRGKHLVESMGLIVFLSALMLGCADKSRKSERVATADSYDSVMLANGYSVQPLFKTKTGHVTATLRVNGTACVFLVDTGGGATLIDISKKDKYQLEAFAAKDYAAGINAASPLVRTSADIGIKNSIVRDDSLFLMDISFINAEFRKNHSKQVDGVLGTDFLDRHHAIVDYSRSTLYLQTGKRSR